MSKRFGVLEYAGIVLWGMAITLVIFGIMVLARGVMIGEVGGLDLVICAVCICAVGWHVFRWQRVITAKREKTDEVK